LFCYIWLSSTLEGFTQSVILDASSVCLYLRWVHCWRRMVFRVQYEPHAKLNCFGGLARCVLGSSTPEVAISPKVAGARVNRHTAVQSMPFHCASCECGELCQASNNRYLVAWGIAKNPSNTPAHYHIGIPSL